MASLGAFAFAGGDAGSARAADAGDWSSPGLGVIPDRPANYVKSPLGVTYERINEGVGDPARPGDVAVFHWILRRAGEYFIYGSVDCGIGCGNGDPSEYVLGPDDRLIPGLDELLTGDAAGEKRRALVPPELGYVSKGMEPQPPEFGQKRQVEVHAGNRSCSRSSSSRSGTRGRREVVGPRFGGETRVGPRVDGCLFSSETNT